MHHYKDENVFPKNEKIALAHFTKPVEPIHTHDFLELVYIESGKGKQYIDGKEYVVARGDLLFINYNHTHAFSSKKGMVYYNIYIKPELLSEELINVENAFQMLSLTAFEDFRESVEKNQQQVQFTGVEMAEVEHCLQAMYREWQNNASGKEAVMKSYLTVILTYMFRKMAVYEEKNEDRKDKIESLIRSVEENCTQKITLKELSDRCFYNPSYFCRIFKEYSGMTLTEFIHESRIKRSCELLATTSMTVEEIAERVGFTSKTQYYKRFRAIMGETPADYRKKVKI